MLYIRVYEVSVGLVMIVFACSLAMLCYKEHTLY